MTAEMELCLEGSRVALKEEWRGLPKDTTGIVNSVDGTHCNVTFLSDDGPVDKDVPIGHLKIVTQAWKPKLKPTRMVT
jgi:hypothetical protein